jgi:uncharacterized membrane protein
VSNVTTQLFLEFLITLLVGLGATMLVYLASPRISRFVQVRRIALTPAWANTIILGLFASYVCVFSVLSILRHLSFYTAGFDVGVFDQSIWNSLHGRLLELSLVYDVRTLLEQRFSPILLAIVPFYAVWDDPVVLLILQSLALAVAVFPIYWFARGRLGRVVAVAIAAAYLLSPAIEFPNLIEFHEVALATPLFAFATFFLLRRNDKAFLICLALSLLVKEELGLTVSFFGLYIAVIQKRWRFGLVLALFGIFWVGLLLQVILPLLHGGGGYYYFGNGMGAAHGRYEYLGASLSGVVTTLLTRPDIWIPQIAIPGKIIYVLHFLVPLAFLPIIGGEVAALALPTLGPSLLSTFVTQYSIASHYALPLVPFLFFATTIGMERILHWADRNGRVDRATLRGALVALIVATSAASYFLQSPGPFAQHFEARQYQSAFDPRNEEAYSMMQEVPVNSVLVAQSELAPHMTHRIHIWQFPYVPDYRQADYLILDKTRAGYFVISQLWKNWFDTGYFETVKAQDDFVIAKRRAPAHSTEMQYGSAMSLLGYTIITTDTLRGGQTFRPIVEWRADVNIDDRYVMQVHLVDAHGHLWAKDEEEPDGGTLPTNRWTANQVVGDQYALKLPPTMPPGDYRLTISVCDPQGNRCLPAHDISRQSLGDEPVVATVHVEKDKASITASELPIEAKLFVDMQEVRFLGFVSPRRTITAGEPFSLGLYWRAREKPRGDYVVAVQLRDANGRVAFENASRPASGAYPTTEWSMGEVLLDWHDFTLPKNLPAGDYTVYVALRDSVSGNELGETRVAPLVIVQ